MTIIKALILSLWFFVSLISMNHIHPFWHRLIFSTSFLGSLCWITIVVTIIYSCRKYAIQSLIIFITFICIGFFLGPFLEPPADPLAHLGRIYSFSNKKSSQIPTSNFGLWHYSMSSKLLSIKDNDSDDFKRKMLRIDGSIELVDGPNHQSKAIMIEGQKRLTRIYGPSDSLLLNEGSLVMWARLSNPNKPCSTLVRVNDLDLYIYHEDNGYFYVYYNKVKLGRTKIGITDDLWHHYSFTWKDSEQIFYIDGKRVGFYLHGKKDQYGRAKKNIQNTEKFFIGWVGTNDFEQWHGPISMFTIFDRALSGDEVSLTYRSSAIENSEKRVAEVLDSKPLKLFHGKTTKKFMLDFNSSDIVTEESRYSAISILNTINLLHGLYWGLVMVVLYIVSKKAGLPDRWAIFSCLFVLLFLGTNRFSYFAYYSLSPSFTSILIYWLWTAHFFFQKSRKAILYGLIVSIFSIPILWVNHIQEAVFMVLIALIWILLNVHDYIWNRAYYQQSIPKLFQFQKLHPKLLFFNRLINFITHPKLVVLLYWFIFFAVFFMLPQLEFFQNILVPLFKRNLWLENQDLLFFWKGFHITGKFWSYRIHDTLGVMGFLPVLIPALFLIFKKLWKMPPLSYRIFVLGLLPLIGYSLPLLNYIWASNCDKTAYYRLSYSSLYWIPIVFLLYSIERPVIWVIKKIMGSFSQKFLFFVGNIKPQTVYFTACLIFLLFIGGIRSGPVYGKMDFLMLDNKPWWNEWHTMIQHYLNPDVKQPIYSDPQTSLVLNSVFNIPICNKTRARILTSSSVLNVTDMETISGCKKNRTSRCIINLKGFRPSWVADETGHWDKRIADTSLYYRYDNKSPGETINFLQNNSLEKCKIYF